VKEEKGPVGLSPAERVHHGWRTLVFRAWQDCEAKKGKPGVLVDANFPTPSVFFAKPHAHLQR